MLNDMTLLSLQRVKGFLCDMGCIGPFDFKNFTFPGSAEAGSQLPLEQRA